MGEEETLDEWRRRSEGPDEDDGVVGVPILEESESSSEDDEEKVAQKPWTIDLLVSLEPPDDAITPSSWKEGT